MCRRILYGSSPPATLANHDSETAHAHIATWIRDHLKKCGAVRYAYAAEMRENGSSQAELVSIEAADYGNAISGIREIIKPKKGKQYLGPLQPVNSPASSAENCCLSEGGSTEFRHVGLAAEITPQKEREVP